MKKFFASVLLFALTAFAIADAQTVNPGGKINAGVTAFINCATNGGIVYNANGVINCSAATITATGQGTFLSSGISTPAVNISNTADVDGLNSFNVLAPNLTANHRLNMIFGKANSSRDSTSLNFRWVGSNSASNAFEVNLNGFSAPMFTINGLGIASIGQDAAAAELQFGGTTSAFVKLKRSSNSIEVKLADNSDYATLSSRALAMFGAVPTPSGSCSVNTQTGGNTAGTFKANGACVAGTVILTFATTAPTGWACQATDQTTPADIMNQTASSGTTATFTGTMANLDVVVFSCLAY